MKRMSEFDSLVLDLTPYQWDSNVIEVPFKSEYIMNLLSSTTLYIKVCGSSLELPVMYFPAKRLVGLSSESITGYDAVFSYSEIIDYNGLGLTYRLTFFSKTDANAKFLIEEL